MQGASRLLDCVERPYAYVRFDAPGPGAAKAVDSDASVRNLLSNPSLDALFQSDSQAGGGSSRALSMVRGMLRRGASEIELALTGVVGRAGTPLLVLRARLEHDQADRLRVVFEQSQELASPNRELGGHQTYLLRGGRGSGVGETVEMAMVGDDFVVGNDSTAMREVLAPAPATTAASGRREVLSNSPRFRRLRDRLDVPAGSLLAYSDWQRLGRRLQSSMTGAHADLLASSGLGSARSMMATIVPEDSGDNAFSGSLLLDFEFEQPKRGEVGMQGWFAATQPVAAKQLLKELPRAGLGGLVLSVDLRAVGSHSPKTSHLYWDLREAFRNFGLDFERNVLGRLASRGTVQLHLGAADLASAQVSPVYSVRAKNRRTAQDLFSDIRRVVEDNGIGELLDRKGDRGKRGPALLKLWGRHRALSAYVMAHDDSLLLASSEEPLVQLHQELQRTRPRGRRDQFAARAVKAIGGEEVAGLFDLDLEPMFGRLLAALGDQETDLDALPQRHVGYLATERSDDGAVVRIRVLSSR